MKIVNSNLATISGFYQNKIEIKENIKIDLKNAKDGDTFVLKGQKLVPVSPDLANNDKVALFPTDTPDYLYKKFSGEFEFDKTNNIVKLKKHNHNWSEINKEKSSINDLEDVEIKKELTNTFLKIENGKIINKPIRVQESNKVKLNYEDKPGFLEDKIGYGLTIKNNLIAVSENILDRNLFNFPYNKVFKKLENESKQNLSINASTVENKPISYFLNSNYIKHNGKRLNNVLENLESKVDKVYYVETFNEFYPSDVSEKFFKKILKGNSGLMFKTYINFEKIKTIKIIIDYKKHTSLFNFKDKDFSVTIYIKQNNNFYFTEIKTNYLILDTNNLKINNLKTDITEIHLTKTDNYQDIEINNVFLELEG